MFKKGQKPPMRRPIETQLLIKRLNLLKENEFIPYEELNTVCGKNVQKKTQDGGAYEHCLAARNHLLNTEGKWFEPVQNQGLTRVDSLGLVDSAKKDSAFINTKNRKRAKKLAATEYEKLPQSGRHEYTVQMALTQAVTLFSSPSAQKKIREVAQTDSERSVLDLEKTLKLFSSK